MSPGEIFLRLVNLAAAGNALVLAALLLRLLLRRAPRRIICLLWAVVAVRLLLPVSIESRVSLVPSAETFPVERIYSSDWVIAMDKDGMHIDTGFDVFNGEKLDEALMPGTASMVWLRSEMLGLIWGVGAVGLLIYAIVSTLRLRRRVSTAVRTGPGVRRSENVESPFVMGLFRPVIYLPFALKEEDLPSVLAHERAHIARGDHIWKLLGFMLLAVYWFDPLFWLGYVLFCRDLELACDEHVTRGMGLTERQRYSESLLNCAVRKNTFTAPPAFGEIGVKQRVKEIMNMKKPALWLVLLSVLAVAVSAACFLTDPVRPVPEPAAGVHTARNVYGITVSEKR